MMLEGSILIYGSGIEKNSFPCTQLRLMLSDDIFLPFSSSPFPRPRTRVHSISTRTERKMKQRLEKRKIVFLYSYRPPSSTPSLYFPRRLLFSRTISSHFCKAVCLLRSSSGRRKEAREGGVSRECSSLGIPRDPKPY